jgi:tRNA 2-thiouridine synthesizing protein A
MLGYLRGMEQDQVLDATGLLCPLPVLKARKRLLAMKPGQVLQVLADDPAAVIDMPHFCAEQGFDLVTSETASAPQVYRIRKV